jgi:hypothetical protein
MRVEAILLRFQSTMGNASSEACRCRSLYDSSCYAFSCEDHLSRVLAETGSLDERLEVSLKTCVKSSCRARFFGDAGRQPLTTKMLRQSLITQP